MMIEPIKGLRSEELALCKCSECCAEETVVASHGDSRKQRRGGKPTLTIQSPGKVHEKLRAAGWAIVKSKLYCPRCDAERKKSEKPVEREFEKMESEKTNVAPIRNPTPEQEVDIIVALSSVYDRKARRYQGQETDRTVAEAVGGGVMPGWVAKIREDKFGPAGNEEIGLIREEIRKLKADTDKSLDALTKRLDACVASHDRRVG